MLRDDRNSLGPKIAIRAAPPEAVVRNKSATKAALKAAIKTEDKKALKPAAKAQRVSFPVRYDTVTKPEATRPIKNEKGQFLQGYSGNPNGRPKGSRNKIGEAFLNDIYADWLEHGRETIKQVREQHPEVYLKVVASLLPRDMNLNVTEFDSWSDEELRHYVEGFTRRLALA